LQGDQAVLAVAVVRPPALYRVGGSLKMHRRDACGSQMLAALDDIPARGDQS